MSHGDCCMVTNTVVEHLKGLVSSLRNTDIGRNGKVDFNDTFPGGR